MLLLRSAAFLSLGFNVYAHNIPRHHRRSIIPSDSVKDSYDFIIAGGGTAGLVLASRLSEDSNTTVLVIEAGDTGESVADTINYPGNAYYNSLFGSVHDYSYPTVAQTNAGGRILKWPRGKVLGGSSAMNGMYVVRPSQPEIDAWGNLVASQTANATTWTWVDLVTAMKKSEDYTGAVDNVRETAHIQDNPVSHGTSGPWHNSYPGYIPDLIDGWIPSMNAMGVASSTDAYAGDNTGAYLCLSAINPSNWTRSYSKSAYIDTLPPRPNLDIVASATVTKIVFDNASSGNLTATGVQFATSRSAQSKQVTVKKEVILASGTVGSPQILMVSGVGPKAAVEAAGVSSVLDLPGVGQHLQDHLSTQLSFSTNEATAFDIHASGDYSQISGGESTFLSYVNSATAYLNLTTILGSDAQSLIDLVSNSLDSSASSIVPSKDSTVIEGYKAIYQATQGLLTDSVAQIEMLMSVIVAPNTVGLQIALQHPFSHGYLYINSSSAFDYPVIDPRYLSHSAVLDIQLLRGAAKFIRQVAATGTFATTLTGETLPGTTVQSDDDIDNWLRSTVGTEFHPVGTCSMLPLSQGGVVDTNLKVHGLSNVRVIDASVVPIELAAHVRIPLCVYVLIVN
ncbi:alcohol oxidase [Amylostereum chailletii]|nr:alcohol oxidase [Amylostereum chailletii]